MPTRHRGQSAWDAPGVDPVRLEVEVHVLENGAYRCAQAATSGDTVRSVLLPDLTFAAARIFTFA